MEEKKPLKIKFKTAIVLIIIGVIILTIFGANVYASANGYGNVFFFIKYLITGEKPEISGKDELLSDRDITISYEPIVLTEKIKIQIRNLQVKDKKAKLFVAVNDNQSTEDTPLMYKVYNNENKLICEQKSSKEDNNTTEYIEELLLKEFKNDEKIIHLEIFNSKNQKLTRITINLETREVIVDGEKEAIEKISEIELKKYLSIIAGFEENFDVNDEDSRISLAIRINSILNRDIVDNGLFDATEVNNILKNLGYGEILTNNYNGEFFKEKVVNGKKYFEMIYEPDTVNMETIVGEIKDITYSSNIYTATFKYLNYSPKTNINYFDYKDDAKEATIYFKLNEDTTYSTFKVVKFERNNIINITEQEARLVLEDKYKNVEKMWLNVTEFFKTDLGKEVKNFEEIVLSYGTENFLKLLKNKLPWGMYMENGKYFIAEGWGGDIGYDGLKNFENIRITNSSIKATVVTKQKIYNGNDWVQDKDKKSEIVLIKSNNKWIIDYFDFNGIFENEDTNLENSKTEYEKAEEAIKSKLLDKNWLKNNTLIKSANGNSNSIEEQDYKFAVIKEQDTKNPVVVLVVTAEKILTQNTFVIRYKNNDVSIEKVSEGHYQHVDTLTNGEYYATTYEHMNEWAFELLEVSSDDIGVVDRNHGTLGDEDYDYMEVIDFENNNNLKSVITELNETNLNKLLKNQKNKNNIITSLTPSGFAGSSLNRVDLYSNKEVYLITFDGNGFEESNIISKELIARNADSIYKSDEGDITVKGGEKLVSTQNWIHFVQ